MASARRQQPPLEIYQDPVPPMQNYSYVPAQQSYHAINTPYAPTMSAKGPVLQPTSNGASARSPVKQSSPQISQHDTVSDELVRQLLMGPPQQPASVDAVPMSAQQPISSYYAALPPKTSQQLHYDWYTPAKPTGKENVYTAHPTYPDFGMFPPQAGFNGYTPALGKRQRVDEPYTSDKPTKKAKVDEDEPFVLPEPCEMPALYDDGNKPAFSYAQLIGFAILRSPNRRLTLAQIYKWISDTFSYYSTAETGWMNSIRHNLSLNKAFIKKERPKDEPGKGNFWAIQPGMEKQFVKDKAARRVPSVDSAPQFQPMPAPLTNTGRPHTASTMGTFALPPKPPRPTDSSRFPATQTELSSDATLPASDPAAQEEEQEAKGEQNGGVTTSVPGPYATQRQTSPASPNIASSPPVARVSHANQGSPPSLPPSRDHRKKSQNTFRDSGFYSSIESSVTRHGQVNPMQLTSEADPERPKIKRGRAEEELARIRSSSFDPSPTLFSKTTSKLSAFPNPSSSPLRCFENASFSPVKTPGVKLKQNQRLASAVSPNTHLQIHRDAIRHLIGTPGPELTSNQAESPSVTPGMLFDDEGYHPVSTTNKSKNESFTASKLSNYFNMSPLKAEDAPNLSLFNLEFPELFDDKKDSFLDPFEELFNRGSPVKSAAQRPAFRRSAASCGILEDLSDSRKNMRLGSPIRLQVPAKNESNHKSPMKKGTTEPRLASPTFNDDPFWGIDFGSDGNDENSLSKANENESIDILKGFQKIGAQKNLYNGSEDKENEGLHVGVQNKTARPTTKSTRPALGRSLTNLL